MPRKKLNPNVTPPPTPVESEISNSAQSADSPISLETDAPSPLPTSRTSRAVTTLPRSPQPNKDRPLPKKSLTPPSAFDPSNEPQEVQAMLDGEMKRRGLDPTKTPKSEFFQLLMWEWVFQGDGKQRDLAARILGRGYIGEKGDENKPRPLYIEGYEDGLKTMMQGAATQEPAPGTPTKSNTPLARKKDDESIPLN